MQRRTYRGRNRARANRGSAVQQSTLDVLKRIEDNTLMTRPHTGPLVKDKLPMQLSNRAITTFKRAATGTTVGVSTSASTFGAASYYLASFDPTSEIAENFQEYRIIELTVKFIPTNLYVKENYTTNQSNSGNFETVIDLHNDTTPISHAELQQYKSYQVVRTGEPIMRTWTPRTLGRVYAGVTDGYYTMPSGVWLSTDYNDVNHYGIKWATGQSIGTGNITVYSTLVEAVIQCRNTL
jgi:hypothetical protein